MKKTIAGLLLAAVLVLAGLPAQAQHVSAAVSACATITSAVARLDCYDRAARAESGKGAQAGQSEPQETHDAPAPAAAPAPEQSEPAAGQSGSAAPQQSVAETAPPAAEAPARPAAAARGPAAAEASGSSADAAPSRPAAAASSRAASSREREAHDQNAKAGGSDQFEVTIVKIRRIRQRTEVFLITDDGHVWRQTDDRQVVFPHTPFRAVISSGFLGSRFLSPVGERFSIHVSDQRN